MQAPETVAVYQTEREIRYPRTPPYHPDRAYPEYAFGEHVSEEPNAAYEAVREALRLLRLDEKRYGTPEWNPLQEILRPDDMVVIKPNMVRDFHEFPEEGTEALQSATCDERTFAASPTGTRGTEA